MRRVRRATWRSSTSTTRSARYRGSAAVCGSVPGGRDRCRSALPNAMSEAAHRCELRVPGREFGGGRARSWLGWNACCSPQRPVRQEVDIHYVVTSLKCSAQQLYENIHCQRGQMENLIKLHKA